MKTRKFAASLVILALLLGIAGTAAAAPGDTVPGAVYSHWGIPPGQAKVPVKIKEDLEKAGVKDVKPTDWFAGSISVLVESGLLKPDATGNVNPDSKIRAAEGISIFAKVLGISSKTDDDATAAAKAKQAGLVDGDVSADREMTRLEVAKLLAKALGVTPKLVSTPAEYPFNDGWDDLNAEEKGILAALYELGVFKGYPDKTFKPGNVLTKAEIAILIDRILGAAAQ